MDSHCHDQLYEIVQKITARRRKRPANTTCVTMVRNTLSCETTGNHWKPLEATALLNCCSKKRSIHFSIYSNHFNSALFYFTNSQFAKITSNRFPGSF